MEEDFPFGEYGLSSEWQDIRGHGPARREPPYRDISEAEEGLVKLEDELAALVDDYYKAPASEAGIGVRRIRAIRFHQKIGSWFSAMGDPYVNQNLYVNARDYLRRRWVHLGKLSLGHVQNTGKKVRAFIEREADQRFAGGLARDVAKYVPTL